MQNNKHIYSFIYDYPERELCRLESKYLFGKEEENKLLFSAIEVEPSHSAFIKNRLDIMLSSSNYATLIDAIKKENIHIEGFKVEYLVFEGDKTAYANRLEKLKDIGYSIEGTPDYYHPTTTYALCYYKSIWYFGVLTKNSFAWQKHNKKPRSYSNSININIAKALVNIAYKNGNNKKIIDACCGVGTIMLEACFAGKNIEGCDINWKVCRNTRENLAHFNYVANVYRSDIKDINNNYDTAIIDLPYNLFSKATHTDIAHIIQSASEIANQLVIVSTSDITDLINNINFDISDYCSVGKSGNRSFARKIWVCNKRE